MDIGALDSPLGAQLLAAAAELEGTEPLAAASRLAGMFPDAPPALRAAALGQNSLIVHAQKRFPEARHRWWTRDGLEQASRPAVSRFRAEELRRRGVQEVVDLTAGLGLDLIALGEAGMRVIGVERDPLVADLAQRNVRRSGLHDARIVAGDCTDDSVLAGLPDQCWFIDPARRSAQRRADGGRRRIDDPQRWSPPWGWVRDQIGRTQLLAAKAAPGIDPSLLHGPRGAGTDIQWISMDGQLLEAFVVWQADGPSTSAEGPRPETSAVLLDDEGDVQLRLRARTSEIPLGPTPQPHQYLVDPDPAIVRAGAVADLADAAGGWLPDPHLAFVILPHPLPSDLAAAGRAWRVLHAGPYEPGELRAQCVEHGIGSVEVTGRGRRLDPARVKGDLRLEGGGDKGTVIVLGVGRPRRTLVLLAVPEPTVGRS